MLKDYDPYDYAKAVRVFQKTDRLTIRFQLYIEANPEILAIEVVAADGARCVQMQVDKNKHLLAKNGDAAMSQVAKLACKKWAQFEININAKKQNYSIKIDSNTIAKKLGFAVQGTPERILFRTGKYRLQDDVQEYKSSDDFKPGWDEPGADEPVPEAVFYVKDFTVRKM